MTIEHSPFAPPPLGAAPATPPSGVPMLPDSAPTLAPATASPALPSLPQSTPPTAPSAPTAPSVPTAPAAGAPHDPSTTPTTPTTTAPTTTAPTTTAPTPKRSRTPFIVVAGLAVATIAGATWFTLSSADDSAGDSAPVEEPAPPTGLDLAPQEVSSPIVVPIDDASEVMAEIDDNSAEAEALDLLGLDDDGNEVSDQVVDEAASADSVAGHRFTWTYGTDSTATITVDSTTGNYQFASTDGIERRYVDNTSYSRRGDIAWAQTDGDALGSVRRMGFDGPILIAEVLDPLTADYTASKTSELDDGTTAITAEVDAFAYSQAHPNEYAEFMASLGHPVGTEAVQPGDIVVIQAQLGADASTIELMTVETLTFATSYSLDELFDTAPVIEAPPV